MNEQRLQSLRNFQYCGFEVPAHMHGAIDRYIEKGIPPGDFLIAVLKNDLSEACAAADLVNMHNIPGIVAWFYNHAPSSCYGSEKKLLEWIKIGGLQGEENALSN